MNKTELFLGDRSNWKQAVVELRSVHGLYGGLNIRLAGSGLVLIQVVEVRGKGLVERQYVRELPDGYSPETETVGGVFDAIVAKDFLTIFPSDRMGLPDEVRMRITVSNAKGDEHTVSVWERTTQSPDSYGTSDRKRFDDIHRMLSGIGDTRKTGKPVYKGRYKTKSWQAFVKKQLEKKDRCATTVQCKGQGLLTEQGSIRISGGCEVYTEGEILFLPGKNCVEVVVENKGAYGYFTTGDGTPLETFRVVIAAERMCEVINRLCRVIDSNDPPESVSTRDARVQVLLPLDSRTVEADWHEISGNQDVDRLLDVIDELVREFDAMRN